MDRISEDNVFMTQVRASTDTETFACMTLLQGGEWATEYEGGDVVDAHDATLIMAIVSRMV